MRRWIVAVAVAVLAQGCSGAPEPDRAEPSELESGSPDVQIVVDPDLGIWPHDKIVPFAGNLDPVWRSRGTATQVVLSLRMAPDYVGGHVLSLTFDFDEGEVPSASAVLQRYNDVGTEFEPEPLAGIITLQEWGEVWAGRFVGGGIDVPFWTTNPGDPNLRWPGDEYDIAVGETLRPSYATLDRVSPSCDGCAPTMLYLAWVPEGSEHFDTAELDISDGPAPFPQQSALGERCIDWNREAQLAEVRFCDGWTRPAIHPGLSHADGLVGMWEVAEADGEAPTIEAGGAPAIYVMPGNGVYGHTDCAFYTVFDRTSPIAPSPWFGEYPLGCEGRLEEAIGSVVRDMSRYRVNGDGTVVVQDGSREHTLLLRPATGRIQDPRLASGLLGGFDESAVYGADVTQLLWDSNAVCPALWGLPWVDPTGAEARMAATVRRNDDVTQFAQFVADAGTPEAAVVALSRGFALKDWCDEEPPGTEPAPALAYEPLAIETSGDETVSFRLTANRRESVDPASDEGPAWFMQTLDVTISTVGTYVVTTIAFTEGRNEFADEFARLSAAAVERVRSSLA